MRIGELASRSGVSVDTVRAWERRYGLLTPERTPGGQRSYSKSDLERLLEVRRLLDAGWTLKAAAEAPSGADAPLEARDTPLSNFHERLLDLVTESVVAAAPDGTIIYWNAASEALYGWSAEEAIGRQSVDLLGPPRSRRKLETSRIATLEGEITGGEFELQRRDGSLVRVQSVLHPLHDSSGRLVAIAGAAWDVAEREAGRRLAQLRAAELESIAVLGMEAARRGSGKRLADGAVLTVRNVLSVPYSCLVAKRGKHYEMIAGNPSTPIGAPLPEREGSLAGYVLRSERAVWSDDLTTERRFDPQRLLDSGFVSALAVPVPRRGGRTFSGVFVVASDVPRTFTVDDANYLQAVGCLTCDALEPPARSRPQPA